MLAYKFASKYLHMDTRRDVFQAIADPTRRQIIQMVATQPLNLNAIAEQFDVSRQAVSLHVKILAECGLIQIRQQLSEVSEWAGHYKKLWTRQFKSLDKYLGKVQSIKKTIK